MSSKQRISVAYDEDAGLVKFSVIAGDDTVARRDFDVTDVHQSLRERVELYGLNKLLTDRTSGTKDKVQKLDDMSEVMSLLIAGEWQKERQAPGAAVVSVNVEALARVKNISVAQAQAALKQYPKEAKEKIFANPRIREMAETIRAERENTQAESLDDLI